MGSRKRAAAAALCAAVGVVSAGRADGSVASSISPYVLFSSLGSGGNFIRGGVIFDAAGNLYGTAEEGGSEDDGIVYEVKAGTRTPVTLATFNGSNGGFPYGGLVADSAGNLYGTTYGELFGNGTVFELAAGTRAFSTLLNFNASNPTTGANPAAALIVDPAGNLYGTTQFGGSGSGGIVFKIAAGTHAATTVAALGGSLGSQPQGSLLLDAAGNLYGTAQSGGANNAGTVFEVPAGGGPAVTLVTFNGSNGLFPYANLVADAAGNLYGTTEAGGGPVGLGTLFELSGPTHQTLTTLVTFNGSNGAAPYSGLTVDAAGDLFGTTSAGGTVNDGTVFEYVPSTGQLTTLASLTYATGNLTYAGVTPDAAGNLFGTAFDGGINNGGTIFEVVNTGFAVPEPATAGVLAIAGLSLLARRRGRPNGGRP